MQLKPINEIGVKDGLYLISEDGDVWSNYKNNFMSPSKDKDGYKRVLLSSGSKKGRKTFHIHTLVALYFIGRPPKELKDPTVNHKDGNILNNNYKNLEWIERSQNSSIRENKGVGEQNHEAKLTDVQVKEICEILVDGGLSLRQIGLMYGVHKSTISNIKRKKNWKHIVCLYDFGSTTKV